MKKRGFTLIEVIVALAIFGILVVVFSNSFSQGFNTILAMGNKSRAVAKAQEYVDIAYQARNADILKTKGLSYESVAADLYKDEYKAGKISKYVKEDTVISGNHYTRLTVVVFYANGKRFVTLISLIPTGGVVI